MDYVHVATALSSKTGNDYSPASVRLSSRALISLIHGLKGKDFGFHSTLILAEKIRKYTERLNLPKSFIYVDSGGYSIITGEVPITFAARFTDCYNRYFEYESDSYDYIFSLDIPFWEVKREDILQENEIDVNRIERTIGNLKHHNNYSISTSLDAIKRHPELANKWFFVWQFKFPSQYKVWSELFAEYAISSVTSNYAIGGLVGIWDLVAEQSGNTLDFTPFTSVAFRCFDEYLNSPIKERPFNLHVLGIYHPIDRLQLILIERIFKQYANSHNLPGVQLTHDTINYTLTGMYKSRSLSPFHFENSQLTQFDSIFVVPEVILRRVYHTEELYRGFCAEIESVKNYKDVSFIVPLNIYSNLCLDQYLKYISDKFQIVNLITTPGTQSEVYYRFNNIVNTIKDENTTLFTDAFGRMLENNLKLLHHLWHILIGIDKQNTIEESILHCIKLLRLNDPFDSV